MNFAVPYPKKNNTGIFEFSPTKIPGDLKKQTIYKLKSIQKKITYSYKSTIFKPFS